MDDILYYLVDPSGNVYVKAGAQSFAEAGRELGLVEAECQEYRFDLSTRRLLADRATPEGAVAVRQDVGRHVGTPDRLMTFAEEGRLPKRTLTALLTIDERAPFLEACTQVERRYTEACTRMNDPCLDGGCAVEGEGEICLQPLLDAGIEYQQACAAEWITRFRLPANRIDAWRNQ